MVKLQTSLIWAGCAQGKYIIRAKGYILAVLRWGDETGTLEGWDPIAYVPVDPAGNGEFFFPGKRGIPPSATHVWARCYAYDFKFFEDASVSVPEKYLSERNMKDEAKFHFSVLTDLHLSTKPWKIRQALQSTESDRILLLGDMTNDGKQAQFETFQQCILETVQEKTIFPVTGNHDVLAPVPGEDMDGCANYAAFQNWLLARNRKQGYEIMDAPDGRAYAMRVGNLELIGLQCVTTGRKFHFPEERQIDWLEEHLASANVAWHIILCHAPLLAHNPGRNEGTPYLNKNRRIQEILNRQGRIIFLSGHTHTSPNGLRGNGEYDADHGHIYLDCGSVVATDTAGEHEMMASDWKDGCRTELFVSDHEVEIIMSSIESGMKFPRGYYRFQVK